MNSIESPTALNQHRLQLDFVCSTWPWQGLAFFVYAAGLAPFLNLVIVDRAAQLFLHVTALAADSCEAGAQTACMTSNGQ